MLLAFLCAPWVILGLYAFGLVRFPPRLPDGSVPRSGDVSPDGSTEPSLVSVIVPARDEEANIARCVRSLVASTYPAFEVLVVDDESQDRTAEIVRVLPKGNARALRLLPGAPLPDGWFGKPWACHQGAKAAGGDLLLFTDADTIHSPGLLGRAVEGLSGTEADVLSVIGRQIMGTFWEKLLQPQFFMLLALRYPRSGEVRSRRWWRHAIANGQFLLFRRTTYEAVDGHRPVRGEVVEDLRMAQLLVRGGRRLVVRGDGGFQTRMYASLGDLVRGWSKNVATAALQTTPSWIQPWILPFSLLAGLVLWLAPPLALLWALATGTGGTLLAWAILTTMFDVTLWMAAGRVMRVSPLFGLLYPLGAAVAGYIVGRSWLKGAEIRWKRRRYTMPRETRLGGRAPS